MKALIVDDDPDFRTVISLALEAEGIEYEVAEDGNQALGVLDQRGAGAFDVILLDIEMPGMDGLEVTARIRRMGGARGRIPIVAMTAHAMQGDRERFLEAGMDGYVAKPFHNQ